MKWKAVETYDPKLTSCRIFGHVCPVFFYSYLNVTETKDLRNISRRIPRDVMFQVARRDDYRMCGAPVPDHLIEFDHIIPHAKGGSDQCREHSVALPSLQPEKVRFACGPARPLGIGVSRLIQRRCYCALSPRCTAVGGSCREGSSLPGACSACPSRSRPVQ